MKKYSFLTLLLLLATVSFAQEKFVSKEIYGGEAEAMWQGAEHIWLKQQNAVPAFIEFRNGMEPDEQTFLFLLWKIFKLPTNYGFELVKQENDQLGWQHRRFQLLVNDVPVSNGIFILHMQNGRVKKFNGYVFKDVNVNTSAAVNEPSALDAALRNIDATKYKWQMPEEESYLKMESGNASATYYPKGKLEIVQVGANTSTNFRLAWKFDIYAQQPHSRNYIFVDAQSGEVIKKLNRLENANVTGTATTVYRGVRTITTDSYNGQYRLKEAPRGNGIHTYNMQTGTSYGNSVEFLDANNNWNNVNANLDQYATDAHWGGEMTYDFYGTMGRNSIDNAGYALNLYMHYDNNYFNAFWDGTRMTFGDGDNGYEPLVSLDITGHEISHGLTERTSNLDYQDESGALNESFSDIFGTAVEWYADSTRGNWTIGEDIGGAFRSMSNPNSYDNPDTYGGNFWYNGTADNGGVHTNSSVQNHWYYRLSQGGAGTNDLGNTYNVTGITRSKATKIAWRDDVFYLTSSSDYADSRFYAIQSANDLYGVCSQEAISTTNAWYAVGVGGPFVYGADAQFTATPVTGCTVPFTVAFTNTSTNTSSYTWAFGDGGTSTIASPSHTYNTLGVYTVKLVSNGGACGVDSLTRTNYINISTSNPCVVIMPVSGSYQTQTACTGTIYDNGGQSGNYTNNTNSTVTIAPTGASQVRLHFTQFALEANYDYLYVYDGPTTGSPVIGSYTGTTIPADITSTGSSITIRQYTDPGVVDGGFAIQWTCINPSSPPVANFKADVTQSCNGQVKFTDLSTGGASSWVWNFGDGGTSTLQHPTHNYINNGTYTVSLQATNAFGNNTMTKTNYIVIAKPAGPAVTNVSSCGPQAFSLSLADANPVTWFDNNGNVVSSSNPFTTPVLSSTTTYYVQDTQPQAIFHAGPADNTIGAGANYNTLRSLRFKVFKSAKLVSVYVYAQGDGYRTVQYRDSLGGVIASKTVFMPNGGSRIYLNFDLTPGGTYELGLRDTVNLYRNSAGAVYPYNDAGGIVSITGNSANAAGYYYFFYDWEVKENDCISQRVPVVATVSPAINISSTSTNVSCHGGNTGAAGIILTGGTPNFSYHWSNNGSAANITSLIAGTYTVTGTDAAGCSITATKTITEPAAIVPTTTVTNVSCNGGNNGAINLGVTGGILSYLYNWGGGVVTPNRNQLSAGTYTVTVTDANLCTATASAMVTQPALLVPTATATNVLCHGGNTGVINLAVTGGLANYTYNWSGGITSQNRSNLPPGSYFVTVSDANSCSATASATITEPGLLVSTATATNVLCNGASTGAVNLTVSGGTTSYSYNWGGGITTPNRTNVGAGNYSVTITDANGCSSSATATITEPAAMVVTALHVDAACGQNNGSAAVSASGGTGGYTYLWNNGATTASLSGVGAGIYTVTVTDNNSCTATDNTTVANTGSPQASTTAVSPLCFGSADGGASVTLTGGTQPYTYLWSNGATTASISNVVAGTYGVTATDAQGCSSIASQTVQQPSALNVSVTIVDAGCGISTGSATASVTGGTSQYTYNWSNGGTGNGISSIAAGSYVLTVTDANQCTALANAVVNAVGNLAASSLANDVTCNGDNNGSATVTITNGTQPFTFAWSDGSTAGSLANVAAGTYTVTVTDNAGCMTTLTETISEPTAINLNITVNEPACYGLADGSASVTASGGIAGYTYSWSNGASSSSLSNISAGSYVVTVSDANNCTSVTNLNVTEPGELTALASSPGILCHGDHNGTASVSPAGGTAPYSYVWCNNNNTSTANNLSAGGCAVTITDSYGCSLTTSVPVNDPGQIQFATTTSNANAGSSDGSVALSGIMGGVGPYTFNWSNGDTAQDLQNIAGGTYSVTVTDSHGCTAWASVILLENPTGIAVVNGNINLSLFPNPVTSGEIVIVTLKGANCSGLKLFDARGRLIKQIMAENATQISFSTVNILSGVYFLNVMDGQNKLLGVKKLVVSN